MKSDTKIISIISLMNNLIGQNCMNCMRKTELVSIHKDLNFLNNFSI